MELDQKRRTAIRRAEDRREQRVGTDDLRALIQAEAAARERDRDVHDRELAELKEELKGVQQQHRTLVNRVLIFAGGFAVVVYFLNWLGPTVVRRLIDAVAGTGP